MLDWTPARDEELATRWAVGLPTRQIAAELSALFLRAVTNNAVIGRAHRIALPPRPSPIKARNPDAPPQAEAIPDPTPPEAPVPQAAPWVIDVPDVDHVVIVRPPMSVLDQPPPIVIRPRPPRRADGSGCSYVFGESGKPGFRFCDADLSPDRRSDYCTECQSRCWRKHDPKPRARENWTDPSTTDAKARVFGA